MDLEAGLASGASSLVQLSREEGLSIKDERFALLLDERDPIKWLRSEFHVPKISEITESHAGYDKGSYCIATYSYMYTICTYSYMYTSICTYSYTDM